MTTEPQATPDLSTLAAGVAGDVLVPGDAGWDAARQPFNLVADQHPAAIVMAGAVADVAAVARFAAARGLSVAPQGTGHGAATIRDLSGTILLKTSRLTGVEVDADAGTAKVEAGALWDDVLAAAAPHGLTGLHGSSGLVGVTGYTTGGGLGWLGRSRGLACNAVRSFEVVTAAGEEKLVDAGSEPELFWALRGGGGSHAIVTSVEFDLVPLETAYAGQMMFQMDRAEEVLRAYLDWVPGLPDEVSTTIKFLRMPPLPTLPEELRGQALVSVGVACVDGDGEEAVQPIRSLGGLHLDTVAEIPAAGLADVAMDPQEPVPGTGGTSTLTGVPDEAAETLLDVAGPGRDLPLVSLELRQLGGALAMPAEDGGAANRMHGEFLQYGIGISMTPELGQAITRSLAEVKERLAPWSTGKTFYNFAEQQPGTRGSFPDEVAQRLADAKDSYDPEGRIVANHTSD